MSVPIPLRQDFGASNFVRIHQTLKITPAMAANVTDKLWEMSDTVEVLEDWEAKIGHTRYE